MSSKAAASFEAAADKTAEETSKDDAPVKEEDAKLAASSTTTTSAKAAEEELGDLVEVPNDPDVLSGRGALVNNHPGNRRFRALCFVRKPLFDAGNHAAKRRIATEIVDLMMTPTTGEGARFLKRKSGVDKGPFYVMTKEQAISKAQQVMRDYKRPDRIAMRENLEASGQLRKRNRTTVSTPIEEPPVEVPEEPIIENPFGVHAHDVLCGRGAFVNGHVGNARLRTLALERKKAFQSGNYTDKRTLAMEIVHAISALSPPGRFLKRAEPGKIKAEGEDKSDEKTEEDSPELIDGIWEALSEEKSIHKACQVMRDIDRPDRKHREERKEERKRRKLAKASGLVDEKVKVDSKEGEAKDVSLSALAEKAAVEVVDKALEGAKSVEI